MRTLTVETVDPRDDDAFRRWFAVQQVAQPVDEPDRPAPVLVDARAGVPAPGATYERWHHLVALADREPVAAARIELTCDSPGLAYFGLTVRPDQRRRGIGSALLAAVESWAVAAGCTVAISETRQQIAAPTAAGAAFAARNGYHPSALSVCRTLATPVPAERLDALDASYARFAAGYTIRTWVDRCPDELAAGRAALAAVISADDPAAGPHRQAEDWDVDRVRATENNWLDQGGTALVAGAVHEATGELVAVTTIARPRSTPGHGHQWGTVVARTHRGHRLGLLIKVANLRGLAVAWPQTRHLSAWNSESNTPMIAINEALGYRTAAEGTDWEKALA